MVPLMEWLRWYAGTVTDPKWRVVSRRAGQPLHVVLAIWAAVLENANEAGARGTLESFDAEDVGAALDLEPAQVEAVLAAMQGKVLDGQRLSGWEKRQPKREREDTTAAERKRRQRERQRDEQESHPVTPSHALEESRVEEKRTEAPPSGEAPARPGRRSALDAWDPTDEHRQLARETGVDLDREAAKFRDYVPNRPKPYRDLDAGFRNWLRDAPRFANGHARASPDANGTHPPEADWNPGPEEFDY